MRPVFSIAVLIMAAALAAGCGQEKPGPATVENSQPPGQQAGAVETPRQDAAGREPSVSKPSVSKPPNSVPREAGNAVNPEKAAGKLPRPPKNMAYATGEKIPEFTFADLNGKQKRSGDLFAANRITVLNLWGTF